MNTLLKAHIPRLRSSISIRIGYPDKKWNKLNSVVAILVVRISIWINFVRRGIRIESSVSHFIRMRMTYGRHLAKSGDKKIFT